MSRRGGAFSAFQKTASQAEAAKPGDATSGSRNLIRRTAKSLNADEAKRLLESLRSASGQADFQKALTNLRGRGWGALKKREAVARLLAMAWKSSLKAAGFTIDQWGFPEMLSAVRAHQSDPGIRRLAEEVERQLKFQPGDLFGSKAGALKQTSSAAEAAQVAEVDVQVTITHPTDRDSVEVTVPASSTMKQVKEALAAKLKRPEVTRNGRMVVENPSGELLPVPDGQRLGGKRQVFMVGITLSPAPASPAPRGAAAAGTAQVPKSNDAEPKATRDRPLNLGEAKELLKAFREIASSKEFQRTLGNIHKQGPDSVQKMQPIFIAQSFNRTMAMYDFPLTTEGYQDMARGIGKHAWNVHVKAQAHEVERLLRMPPGAFFGIPGEPGQEPEYPPLEPDPPKPKAAGRPAAPKPAPAVGRAGGIEVVARHAVDNVEVRVELPQNATFYDCKQAISKLLGRDEILRKGRLVQKKGGLYSAYKDDDFVGETRQVLVLGADLQTVQPDEPMPPVHPYADVGRPPSRPLKGESDDEGPPRPQPYSVRSRVHEELEAAPRVNDLPQTPMPPPPPQLQPKPTPKPKPKPVPRPPQEYEITIKHAVEPGEVQLKIWSNWTFAAVRDALAKKLRREEIQKRARFVFKAGTGTAPWVAFKDDEIVGWTHEGHRREELMLLGVELVEQEVSSGPVSVELTRKLLEEFEKACAQEEVQAQLQKLIDRGGVALQLGLTQLMGQALQKVTDLVGVGRNWKLQRFLDTVKTHANDKATRELASSVEDRLRLDPGKLFGLAGPKKAPVGSGLLGRPPVELEEEVQEEGVPELSVQQAVALQRELHQGFSAPSFQQRLDNLENFHSKDPKLILLRQELFLSVQSQVLPKYGFRGDLKGVFDMLEAFKKPEFAQNEDFMRLGSALNALLRLTPDGRPRPRPAPREAFPEPAKPVREVFPEPKSKPPAAKPRNAPRNDVVVDIEVVVRHAVEEDHPDEEARFVVKSNATMKAVREALAAHLGKPELLKTCRLVQRVGENGAFSSFKDSEKLNSRRALLVLGVPSLRTASEEAEDQPSQWAQPRLDEPTQASVQPPEPPKLTLHQALALQRDLLQGFSDSTFQAKRKELVQAYKQTDPKRFSAERQKLFLSVQKVVLPRYGFEAGPKGVFDMLVQFDQSELVMNPTFQQQGTALNHLLFPEDIPNAAAPEATAAAAQAQQGKPPESKTRAPPQPVRYEVAVDMEVVVRHAVQEGRLADEEARFTVKSNATMKAVKEALASHLGKPELVKTCRLVQSVGDSAFSSFKDSEKLNNRRALLVMGVPSLRTAAEDAQEEKAGRTQAAAPPEKSEKQFQPEERRPAQASRAPRVVQPEAPPLTIPQALALQRDLLQRFSDPEFQSKRKELVETYKQSDPRRFSAERQKLFLSVQKLVLPRYGFEGSPKGVFEMMVQFDRPELVMNSTFQHQGATLNYLLFAEDLPEPSQMAQETAQETAPQAPVKSSRGKGRKQKAPQAAKDEVVVDIEVVLRHAVEEDHPLDEEARFTVKSNADMKQVKEALAAHLGKPELVKSCRLVQRLGENSAFTSFKDSEKLNNRRALLVLGVNSLRTASEDAQEEKERSARREEKPQEEKLHPLDREDQASPEATWTPPTRVVQPEAPKLTIPQALALQRDLLQGFSDAEFQAKRKELVDKYKQSKPRRFSAERQKLFLSVQKIVLPRYGFEAGPKGVFDMLVQFDRPEFASNPTFMEQGATLNYLLFPEDLPGGLNNAKEFLQAQTVERTPPRAEPRPPRAARKPRKAAEPHRLTPAQAVALQEDLRQGFADPTWQAKRKELEKTLKHSDPRKFSVERQKLFLSVQKEVLPKHGFEGSPKGVFEMMQQFDRPDLQINEDFQRLGAILNDLLFSEEPTGTGSRRVEPKEIEVTIRHALDEPHLQDEEAQLLVSTDATFRQLKEALAEQLEDPQVLQTCRFVRRVGESGAFSSFMESERLGKRRSLLVIGVQNLLRPDERSKRLRKPLSPRLAMAKLTPQQAVALQKELYEGFSSPLFRERLKKLWQQKPTMESRKYRAERQKLFLTVQSAVLPRYGLEGTERGVFEMLSQFDQPEIHSTEEFQQMGNMLNDLLYGGEPAVGAKVVAEAPKEVQVRVRRAGGDTKEEVHVTVPSTASMLDVRTAVARKCNASFLHEGRLVRNQGGVLVGYKDSEPLGGRRRLLFVGPPLWPEGAPIAAPEAPPAPVDSDSEGLEEANAQPGELTLENARRFLSKVKDACAGMDFQKQLMDIATKARQRADTALARMGIGALFISSCRQILRRFGFAHDRQGYDQMFGAIFPHGEDPEVFSLTRDIEKLLGVPPGSWFGIIREEDHLEETPQLTRDEAKRLIAEVRRLVAAPNFLRDIAAIRSRVGTPEEALQQVYMTLYQLLRPTALAFRLRGDPGCLVRMQEAIAPHLKDSKLRSTIHEVETRLLQVESGSLLGPRDGTIAQDTVKLRIRHAISDAEVRLTVPAGSTMGDILQALAKAVDDPNVLKQGRLVEQRKGGAFTSFQDSEQLGKRRRLLLLGVELQDASRSGKPKLTREQAVQLQLELLSEFSSASFQRRLAELKNAHPNGPHFYVERRKLILSVQTKVIPKFGFAGDLGGVLEMVRVLGSFPDGDGEMGRRGWEIERLIGEREELEATSPRKDGLETDASEEVLDLQEAPPARSDAETVPTDAVDTFSDFVAALDELDHEMPDDAVSPKAGSMAFAPNNTAVEADAIEHSPIEADTLEVSDSKEVEEAPGKADASAVEDAEETPMEDDALEMEVARLVQETPAEAAAVETEVEKDDALETEAATLVEETRAEADSGAANAVEESTVEAAAVEDEAVEKDDALETEAATLVEETPAEADSGAAEAAEESAVEASAADEHEAAEQAAAETEAEEADAVDIEAVEADAVEMEAAEAVEEEGDFKDTDGEEEEDEDIDEDWDEAARIVDEISSQIQEVLAATRTASKKEKAALLAQKRDLESSPEYIDALAYLEDPDGERRRRQEADAEASTVVEEVATQIAEVLARLRSATKKDKPGLLAHKRELENLPKYVNALRYLEDPVQERQRKRQEEPTE